MKLFNIFKPEPEWKNPNWEVRLNAVEKITDQRILKKIAIKDKDERVAIKAITNLTDQGDIYDILNILTNLNVKIAAAQLLNSIGLLKFFTENNSYKPIGSIIIEKLLKLDPDHQKTLAFICINAKDFLFQEAAIEKLNDQNWISFVVVYTKSNFIRDKAFDKLDQAGILETIFKTENDYQGVKMRSKRQPAGEKITGEDPYIFQRYEIYCKAWEKFKNNEIKEIILGNKEVASAPISEVPSFKFKRDDPFYGFTSLDTDWTRRRNEELREMINKETINKNVLLIDNTTPDDNWITNRSNTAVTIACSEMFGAFTIDLKPNEIKRITFNIKANVYPIGQYSYGDLKYEIGKNEKWEVKSEKGELVLNKVDGYKEKEQLTHEENDIKEIHIFIQEDGDSNVGFEIVKSLNPNCLSQTTIPKIIMHNVNGEWPLDIQFYAFGNLRGQGISLSDTNCFVETGSAFEKKIYVVYLK